MLQHILQKLQIKKIIDFERVIKENKNDINKGEE